MRNIMNNGTDPVIAKVVSIATLSGNCEALKIIARYNQTINIGIIID
jgi:hypothetical protein